MRGLKERTGKEKMMLICYNRNKWKRNVFKLVNYLIRDKEIQYVYWKADTQISI